MKKIILYFMLGMLIFASCDKKKECKEVKRPKDLKPIDWENYNNVYTVFWNYSTLNDWEESEYNGKIVEVSGWKAWSYDLPSLCDDPKYSVRELGYTGARPIIIILCKSLEVDSMLNAKMNASDLTQKCFVKGEVEVRTLPMNYCTRKSVAIWLTNIDDIYFK